MLVLLLPQYPGKRKIKALAVPRICKGNETKNALKLKLYWKQYFNLIRVRFGPFGLCCIGPFALYLVFPLLLKAKIRHCRLYVCTICFSEQEKTVLPKTWEWRARLVNCKLKCDWMQPLQYAHWELGRKTHTWRESADFLQFTSSCRPPTFNRGECSLN